jgi:hypothetical protein
MAAHPGSCFLSVRASDVYTATGADSHSVSVGDMDGDGLEDVVAAFWNTKTVSWFRNLGGSTPTWSPANSIGGVQPGEASLVQAVDVNGDGSLDVVSQTGNMKLSWHLNGGVGIGAARTWTTFNITAGAENVTGFVAADMDKDGRADIVCSTSYTAGSVVWYKAGGGGSVPVTWTRFTISPNGGGIGMPAVGDFDGDGRLDVVSGNYNTSTVVWHRNSAAASAAGTISWSSYQVSVTPLGPTSSHAADVDGDGRVDVLVTSQLDHTIWWLRNTPGPPTAGNVTFVVYTVSTSATGANSVRAADVDSDGRMDVVSANRGGGRVVWYQNTAGPASSGNVTWTPRTVLTGGEPIRVVLADVNGDDRVDVVSAFLAAPTRVSVGVNMNCPGGRSSCPLCATGYFKNLTTGGCNPCPVGAWTATPGCSFCALGAGAGTWFRVRVCACARGYV